MNITVPARMVTNDQVKSGSANGCISMTTPTRDQHRREHLPRPAAQAGETGEPAHAHAPAR